MPLHNKSGNELPHSKGARSAQSPVVLIKWYDVVKWLLERVDSFPKNQRFVFGQRLADRAIDVLELLVEAAYSPGKMRRSHLLPEEPS